MKKVRFYKFCKLKAYFERGYSLTNPLKYLIVLLGLAEGFTTNSLNNTLALACLYLFSCFFIGWGWFRYGLVLAEQEVGNQFNLFVKEMRKKIK